MSDITPITPDEVESSLTNAINLYYQLQKSGTADEINAQKNIIENLQFLKMAFSSGNPNTMILQMANSFFETAKDNINAANISNAFDSFRSYTKYVTQNSIGYDTTTNTPIFSTSGVTVLYDNSGVAHNIAITGGQ